MTIAATAPDSTAAAGGAPAAPLATTAAGAAPFSATSATTAAAAALVSRVLEEPPLAPGEAVAWFGEALRRHTDASDVYADLQQGITAIVVIDARSAELYAQKHIPGAVSLPHRTIGPETLAWLPQDKVIVTYCDGIGCNGSTKAALKLARLGYRVKELLGGLAFWEFEGFPIESGAVASGPVESSPVESSTGPGAALCAVDGSDPDCGC